MTKAHNSERAFVLHSTPYSESSLLVDFFCEHSGLVRTLAKGARRPRSSLKSLLQPFTPLFISFVGKSQTKTLTAAEGLSLGLSLQIKPLYCGLYINELLMRTLGVEHNPQAFFLTYVKSITRLAKEPEIEPILREFEFSLLDFLGYAVNFTHCFATGEPIVPEMRYQFHPEKGFVASLLDNSLSYRGIDLLAFAEGNFNDKAVQSAAKRFTRLALKPYLGHKPLKSRELFVQLSATKRS